MKRLYTFFLVISCLPTLGQTDQSAPYLKYPGIPSFELLLEDGHTTFTNLKLNKTQPVMIMYFNPTCDHCIHQTVDLLKEIDSFKNIQIVMATLEPLEAMKEFSKKYKLGNHRNIVVGRDTKYILPPFYRIPDLPYLALYNKDGKLITTFVSNHPISRLLYAFRLPG